MSSSNSKQITGIQLNQNRVINMNKKLIMIVLSCVGFGILEVLLITGNLQIPQF
jgi:hypothetical protein